MFGDFFSRARRRGSWLITLIGTASFAACFGLLSTFAAGWTAIVSPSASEAILSFIVAVVIAPLR